MSRPLEPLRTIRRLLKELNENFGFSTGSLEKNITFVNERKDRISEKEIPELMRFSEEELGEQETGAGPCQAYNLCKHNDTGYGGSNDIRKIGEITAFCAGSAGIEELENVYLDSFGNICDGGNK